MALDVAKNVVYLADDPADAISIISLKSYKVVQNITDLGGPMAAIYDSAKGEIFALNYNSGNVSVINDTTNTIVANISVGTNPGSGVYVPSKNEIFVANEGSQTVSVISDTNNTVVDTIGPNVGGTGNPWPNVMLYDSNLGEVFAPAGNGVDFISVINNTVVTSVNLGNGYNGAALDLNNGDLYIAGGSYVYVVSIAQAKLIDTINYQAVAPYFAGVGYDAVMHDIYVLEAFNNNASNNGGWADMASIISDSSNSVIGNISLAVGNPSGILYDPLIGEMFISGGQNGYYAQVTVTSPLNLTASPESTDLGGSTALSVDLISGAPVLSYSYAGLPPGAISQNKSSLVITPSATGKYAIKAYANDSGGSASASTTLQVNPPLTITSFSASPSTVDAGNSVVLTTSVSGGTSPFSYSYTGLPPGGAGSNNSSITFSPTSVGTYSVIVTVSDAVGISVNATLSLTVNAGVVVPSISASNYYMDVGQSIVVRTNVSGGVAPYTYSYNASGAIAGNLQSSTSQLDLSPTVSGNFTVTVKVTDSIGDVGTATTPTMHVDPQMNVTLAVSNSTPLLGQTIAVVANVTGGAKPYTYNYTGLPPGAVSEDKPAIGFLPTQADFYNITVHVTDANGNAGTSTVSLHVIFDFNVVVTSNVSAGSTFTISVNTNQSFSAGTAVSMSQIDSKSTMSATPYAGIGILTYNYTGLPPGVKSQDTPTLRGVTNQPGTYHINVTVRDQAGDHNSHVVVLVVLPANSNGISSLLSGTSGYLVIGGIAAVISATAAVLVARRKQKK